MKRCANGSAAQRASNYPRPLPMYVNFWGMLYNKQMFQEASLPELTTESVIMFDDWITYAHARNKPADMLEEPGGREGGSTSASPASL